MSESLLSTVHELKVQTAGSAACYRNPRRPDEIFYVEVSSPKGYQFNSLADLGTEQDAFKRFVDQVSCEDLLRALQQGGCYVAAVIALLM